MLPINIAYKHSGFIIAILMVLAATLPSYLQGTGQSDFKVVYAAVIADEHDLNPYHTASLSRAIDEPVVLPYVYLPSALLAYRPFTLLNIRIAGITFLSLKLLALIALTFLLYRIFALEKHLTLLLIFIPFAFNGTVLADLRAGNISIFEQLVIWLALYCYLKNKPAYFASLIVVVASFKLTPICLIALLIIRFRKHERRIALLSVLIFIVFVTANALLAPDLFSSFLENAFQINTPGLAGERGELNPSTLQLLHDVFHWIADIVHVRLPKAILLAFYIIIVGGVLAMTLKALLRLKPFDGKHEDLLRICLICLSYAIVVPRFKNYSYILLIGPSIYLMISYAKNNSLLSISCMLLMIFTYRDYVTFGSLLAPLYRLQGEYFSLLLAWFYWGLCCFLIRSIKMERGKPGISGWTRISSI